MLANTGDRAAAGQQLEEFKRLMAAAGDDAKAGEDMLQQQQALEQLLGVGM